MMGGAGDHTVVCGALRGYGVLPGDCVPKAASRQWTVGLMCLDQARWTRGRKPWAHFQRVLEPIQTKNVYLACTTLCACRPFPLCMCVCVRLFCFFGGGDKKISQ